MDILYLILFIFFSGLSFTIPGFLILKTNSLSLNILETLTLSTVVGFVSFTLTSYILIILNISFMLIPIILISLIIFVWALLKRKITFKTPRFNVSRLWVCMSFIVFILGIAGQLAIIAPSGRLQNHDLVFWSAHGRDGIWHIALIEELKKSYPLQNPIFAHEKLVNYHFFSDIPSAMFSKYFMLSPLDLYFRFFPLLFSILLGAASWMLGQKIGKTSAAGLWASIFTYFTGSFGYLITVFRDHSIGGETLFWSSQIQSSIGNPPQITSLIILLVFLYFFYALTENRTKLFYAVCVLMLGTLIVFKVYAGIVALICVLAISVYQLLIYKKVYFFGIFIPSLILSLALYLPNTAGSASFLIWEPWWFVRTMVVGTDKLNWIDLELRRQTYIYEGNWKRVLQVELTAFLIFVFGNLGTRFVGFWFLAKNFRSNIGSPFIQLITLMIVTSFILPLLFLQKGVAGNTIQFLQYYLLLMGILAGVSVSKFLQYIKHVGVTVFVITVIIVSSVPTQIGLIYMFYSRPPYAKISITELEALRFLKDNASKDAVILSPPFQKYLKVGGPILPIWAWSDTAYVAAISGRRSYLADTEQVDILGYSLDQRFQVVARIFSEQDPAKLNQILSKHRIDFIYLPKALKINLPPEIANQVFFENSEIQILKVSDLVFGS